MATLSSKISISLFSSVLFTLINYPETYKITNKLLPFNLYNLKKGCPTDVGLVLHTLVFFALTFLSMRNADVETGVKLKHSLYGTLIFYLLSSPVLFSLLSKVLGKGYSSLSGCPTIYGVLLNALLYGLVLVGVMYLP